MKMRVVILPDGSVGVFVDEGTFAEGAAEIKKMFAELGVAGVTFAEVGEPEQHRHDDAGHVHSHNEQHAHSH